MSGDLDDDIVRQYLKSFLMIKDSSKAVYKNANNL